MTSASTNPSAAGLSVRWVVAAAIAFGLLLAQIGFNGPVHMDPEASGRLISARYDPPTTPAETGLTRGDGQLFATHAADPFLSQPELIRGGPAEQAYRFQRPAYGWLGWALSGGRPGAVPAAVVLLTVASVALLVGLVARQLQRSGASATLALGLLVLPGVVADLQMVGPEALGTALLVIGLAAWRRDRLLVAVGAFAAAGLCRETLLLVPAVLVLWEFGHRRVRSAMAVALSAVPYVAWVLVLRLHLGEWPEGTVDDRLSIVPFAGLVRAAELWEPTDVLMLVLLGALTAAALWRGTDPVLRLLVAAHVVLAATLGWPVWGRYLDFGRVLLPLGVFALLALTTGPACNDRSDQPEVTGPEAGERSAEGDTPAIYAGS